jgi:hypothetical protein
MLFMVNSSVWHESYDYLRLAINLSTHPPRVVLNPDHVLLLESADLLECLREGRELDFSRMRLELPHGVEQARAFWINVYNALVLHSLRFAKQQQSVLSIWGFFSRFAYRVGDLTVNLDQIEHGILRGNPRSILGWGKTIRANDPLVEWVLPLEPRIHFALNCGAISCPPIRAYHAETLEQQLELATQSYLQSARVEGNTVILPRILQWYAQDFKQDLNRETLEFVRRYRPDLPARAKVRFDAYDWNR